MMFWKLVIFSLLWSSSCACDLDQAVDIFDENAQVGYVALITVKNKNK